MNIITQIISVIQYMLRSYQPQPRSGYITLVWRGNRYVVIWVDEQGRETPLAYSQHLVTAAEAVLAKSEKYGMEPVFNYRIWERVTETWSFQGFQLWLDGLDIEDCRNEYQRDGWLMAAG